LYSIEFSINYRAKFFGATTAPNGPSSVLWFTAQPARTAESGPMIEVIETADVGFSVTEAGIV